MLARMPFAGRVKALIEKIASDNQESRGKRRSTDKLIGGGLLAGAGARTVSHAYHRGMMTGRETLYHNTALQNVESVLDKGLDPAFAADPNNLTNSVLGKRIPAQDLKGKVYFGRNKLVADSVGITRHLCGLSDNVGKSLRANVPTWRMPAADNPELTGAKSAKNFHDQIEAYRRSVGAAPKDKAEEIKNLIENHLAYQQLGPKGTAVIEGAVGPEYFTDSKHYKRLGLEELGQYIAKNKGRFARGSALSLAGVAALGVGGRMVTDSLRNNKGH